jgi:hypothetical protein
VIAPLRGRCAQAACTLLELVRLVPEELEEKRLSMSPQRRKALLAVLREEGSAGLARWLAGACAAEEGGGGVTAAQAAELWRAAFGCLHSWLRAELVPEPLLRSTPLLGLALRTLLLPPHAAEEGGGGGGGGAGGGGGGGLLRIGYRCRSTLDAAREAAADVICAAVAARDGGGEVVRQLLAHVDALSAAALPPREDGAQPPAAAAASAGGAQRRGACRVLVALGAATAPDLARLEGGAPVSRACPSWDRSMLAEIDLCHACSYPEIEDGALPQEEEGGVGGSLLRSLGGCAMLAAAGGADGGGCSEGTELAGLTEEFWGAMAAAVAAAGAEATLWPWLCRLTLARCRL